MQTSLLEAQTVLIGNKLIAKISSNMNRSTKKISVLFCRIQMLWSEIYCSYEWVMFYRYIKSQVNCCAIDPFNNIFPILDRMKIQQILIGLETVNIEGRCKIRAPHFIKVNHPKLHFTLWSCFFKIKLQNYVNIWL